MWILLIILVFYGLSVEIKSVLEVDGLERDIGLVPIGEVPFPAIIVDLGGEVDPVGYIAASKDIVNEHAFPKEGIQCCHLLIQRLVKETTCKEYPSYG